METHNDHIGITTTVSTSWSSDGADLRKNLRRINQTMKVLRGRLKKIPQAYLLLQEDWEVLRDKVPQSKSSNAQGIGAFMNFNGIPIHVFTTEISLLKCASDMLTRGVHFEILSFRGTGSIFNVPTPPPISPPQEDWPLGDPTQEYTDRNGDTP